MERAEKVMDIPGCVSRAPFEAQSAAILKHVFQELAAELLRRGRIFKVLLQRARTPLANRRRRTFHLHPCYPRERLFLDVHLGSYADRLAMQIGERAQKLAF